MSAIVSVVTFLVQRSTEAVHAYPLTVRVKNALIAYAGYIGQMFWPAGLAVLYPYRHLRSGGRLPRRRW